MAPPKEEPDFAHDLQRLQYEVRGKKSAITKVVSKINESIHEFETDALNENDKISKLDIIVAKTETLLSKIQQIQKTHDEILKVTKTEDIENTVDDFENYMADMQEKYTLSKRWSDRHTAVPRNVSSSNNQSQTSAGTTQKNVYLPKLQLSMFSGNTVEWTPFYDSFKAAIANNSSLGNVQKFQYLRSQLQGEALLAIEGLQLTDANYDNAIGILTEQYGRPEKIKAAHMKALWELKSPTHDHKGLKEFSDSLESNLRGLSALGTSENSIEDLLVPLILEKIPPSVHQFMTQEPGSSVWTLKELKLSLKKK